MKVCTRASMRVAHACARERAARAPRAQSDVCEECKVRGRRGLKRADRAHITTWPRCEEVACARRTYNNNAVVGVTAGSDRFLDSIAGASPERFRAPRATRRVFYSLESLRENRRAAGRSVRKVVVANGDLVRRLESKRSFPSKWKCEPSSNSIIRMFARNNVASGQISRLSSILKLYGVNFFNSLNSSTARESVRANS